MKQRGFVFPAIPAWLVIAGVSVLAFTLYTWWIYNKGGDARELEVRAEYEAQDKARRSLRDEILSGLRDESAAISTTLEKKINSIRVVHTTVNNQLKTEKEVHHVLTASECAWPVSTVRVRNAARLDSDQLGRSTTGGTAGPMPAAASAANGSAATAR
jgi:hypothetical protein